MDGLQERLRYSIQVRLSLWLSVAIAVAAIAAGTYAYVGGFYEAYDLQDDGLRQVAVLVAHQPGFDRALVTQAKDADPESNLVVQLLGEPPQGEGAGLAIPVGSPDGLQTLDLNSKPYRVLVARLPDGRRFAVAQETEGRDEVAEDAAFRSLLPWMIAVPLLIWIVTRLTRKMLGPITRLASEIDRRGEHELHPLDMRDIPLEIRPFIVAIDSLLARVGRAMNAQRRFVADAAHELRSPLAALTLQAERMDGAHMSALARDRLHTLRAGMDRARHLLEQLLDFARAEGDSGIPPGGVSLSKACRGVLEDLMPLAEAKRLDIGMTPITLPRVAASEGDANTIVRNLIDNAIRYAPTTGGRVDVTLDESQGWAILRVEDNGPGISPEERQRVLDPFYRVLGSGVTGSGLGLSIVKTIVQRLKGNLYLADAEGSAHGLRVTIRLPIAPPPVEKHPPELLQVRGRA